MPICVISTVGQSVLRTAGEDIRSEVVEFARQGHDISQIASNANNFPGKNFYDVILSALTARENSLEFLYRASAELNSLIRILADKKSNNNDELHLIATDTVDGVLAARILADFCNIYFERTTKIHIVDGLQVMDGIRFRRQGLRNLITTIYTILDKVPAGTYTRVFNPTGGFKGVVPYLTIIGMLESEVEISYIYERSPDLITLAGLPIQLDYERLSSVQGVIRALEGDMVNESQLHELLELTQLHISEHPIWSMLDAVEIDDEKYYELNGLGQIVLEHFRVQPTYTVYLSKQAADRYDKLDKTQQKKFAGILNTIQHPEQFERYRHAYKNPANAIALKQGNVDERVFCFLDDETVTIAEFAYHAASGYDREPQRRKDYDRFRLWEGQ